MNAILPAATGGPRRRSGRVAVPAVTMAHGAGGRAMRDLIDDVFRGRFGTPAGTEDSARVTLAALALHGDRLAFTTDGFVVDPLFFPGGDIGRLAVCGTVNDLAVGGATPLHLSCAVILEEGTPIDDLRRVADSMAAAAAEAGVSICTGDTKVVPHGAADKLFITTAGIGVIGAGIDPAAHRAEPGDMILVNGMLGDHGAAILNARGDMALATSIASDCAPLNGLVMAVLRACPDVHCLRDATRGGVATVLTEIADASNVGISVDEASLPVRDEVRGMCEILGLDPLYLANEGKLVVVVPEASAGPVLEAMRRHPYGVGAISIGRVLARPAGTVLLETVMGGRRVVDMLVGDQLPRIC